MADGGWPEMKRQTEAGVQAGCPYSAVGMHRASHSAIGFPRRSTNASRMLGLVTPPDVSRSFTVPPGSNGWTAMARQGERDLLPTTTATTTRGRFRCLRILPSQRRVTTPNRQSRHGSLRNQGHTSSDISQVRDLIAGGVGRDARVRKYPSAYRRGCPTFERESDIVETRPLAHGQVHSEECRRDRSPQEAVWSEVPRRAAVRPAGQGRGLGGANAQ